METKFPFPSPLKSLLFGTCFIQSSHKMIHSLSLSHHILNRIKMEAWTSISQNH